jgi:hypothetical protein
VFKVDCYPCPRSSGFNFTEQDNGYNYVNWGKDKILQYSTGEVYGSVLKYGTSISGQTIPSQDLVIASRERGFCAMKAEGILGICYPGLSELYPGVFQNLYTFRLIDHLSFSVYIADDDFGRKNASLSSMAIFGGYDLKTYSKDKGFTYLNLAVRNQAELANTWNLHLTSIKVGPNNVSLTSRFAILDTGKSLLIGPRDEVSELLALIRRYISDYRYEQGFLVLNSCPDVNYFPRIIFGLNDIEFAINPNYYVAKIDGTCIVLIKAGEENDAWTLGTAFFRSFYVLFDLENELIGLARSASTSDSAIKLSDQN